MKITALLDNFKNNIEKRGVKDPEIKNIEFDSRRVEPETMFFALKGIHTDGHNYIDKAIELGASAICHSDELPFYNPEIVYLKVEDTKLSLSEISAAFYNFPSRELKVIGVTGTDGKSTTVSLINQLLELADEKCGYISTISFKSGDVEQKNVLRQSTPEANQIHRILREMVDNGKKYAVVESTSHGLSHKTARLKDVEYDCGVLTNITQEHLEFHGTLEQYRSDKGNLFRNLSSVNKTSPFGVVNLDDPESSNFIEYAKPRPTYSYSTTNPAADLFADDIKADPNGTDTTLKFRGENYPVRLNLPGLFNIDNLMATLLAVHLTTGKSFEELVKLVPKLSSVKGRMNAIPATGGFSVMVDYAHTPGAFEKVLPTIKKLTKNRLIVVFGSAGERDTVKRPIQGEIADKFADIIILTDEDPRLEDSLKIIKEIQKGIKNKIEDETLYIVQDRASAISKAIDIAGQGDMIVTLGKGHESSIEYSHGSEPWNEIEIVESILKKKNLL